MESRQNPQLTGVQRIVLMILRMGIGWHFLYEGAAKLLTPEWSSAGYLLTSTWVLSGFFHWIASTPLALDLVDGVVVWGSMGLGLALIFGLLTRAAAVFGMLLVALFYLAHPPLVGMDFLTPAEGHYLIVNKNLVELFALALLAVRPGKTLWGLDRLIFLKGREPSPVDSVQGGEAKSAITQNRLARREIFANLAALPVLGVFFLGARKKYVWEKTHGITGATIKAPSVSLQVSGELPKGKIGPFSVSRIILGSNLIGGVAHVRDLKYGRALFKAYNTDRKILETLELAERAGVDMFQIVNTQFPIFHKYQEIMSGKMQTMCALFPKETDIKTDIDKAIDNGATTLYIQGAICDRWVQNGKIDLLGKALDYAKSQGYVSGVGAHSIEVPKACEREGLSPDYYVKTLHHDRYWSAHPRERRFEFEIMGKWSEDHNQFHDNMFDLFPDRTIEFMKQVSKPWVAFKVLAGGAIHPKEGFRYAFENGADFVCVGMFDFEIAEDVNIALEVLASNGPRDRAWMT